MRFRVPVPLPAATTKRANEAGSSLPDGADRTGEEYINPCQLLVLPVSDSEPVSTSRLAAPHHRCRLSIVAKGNDIIMHLFIFVRSACAPFEKRAWTNRSSSSSVLSARLQLGYWSRALKQAPVRESYQYFRVFTEQRSWTVKILHDQAIVVCTRYVFLQT